MNEHGNRRKRWGPPSTEPYEKKWPNGRVIVIGHRGLSPGYPENTLAAFRNAIAVGVDAIELDLQGSRDGIPVVMHDPTVDRTTDGKGVVADLALTELKRLDAGSHAGKKFSNERIPTYEEVLLLTSKIPVSLLLDIKSGSSLKCDWVVGLTGKHRALLRIIIGARTIEDVRLFRQLNPNLRILGLVKNRKDIKSFVNIGVDFIRVWPEWLHDDARLVRRMHKAGIAVWVTAGEANLKALKRLIDFGVNGIITDRPAILAKLARDIDSGAVHR